MFKIRFECFKVFAGVRISHNLQKTCKRRKTSATQTVHSAFFFIVLYHLNNPVRLKYVLPLTGLLEHIKRCYLIQIVSRHLSRKIKPTLYWSIIPLAKCYAVSFIQSTVLKTRKCKQMAKSEADTGRWLQDWSIVCWSVDSRGKSSACN